MIELIVESGTDYRELFDLLDREGYEILHREGGRDTYEMTDGTLATFRIVLDAGSNKTDIQDFVQDETEGAVEVRKV